MSPDPHQVLLELIPQSYIEAVGIRGVLEVQVAAIAQP